MTQLPADAYPVAVYSGNRHLTPDRVLVESSETSICLWIDGLMVGVSPASDDTRLAAALHIAMHISQACERYGSLIRAEQERRERVWRAEPTEAAMRAAEGSRTDSAPGPSGRGVPYAS